MKSLQDYTTVIRPDDNGTFVAYLPAIVGCHAWGQTPEEARAELVNVFEMIREEYQEQGQVLPDDVELVICPCQLKQKSWKRLLPSWAFKRRDKREAMLDGNILMDAQQQFQHMEMRKSEAGYFTKF